MRGQKQNETTTNTMKTEAGIKRGGVLFFVQLCLYTTVFVVRQFAAPRALEQKTNVEEYCTTDQGTFRIYSEIAEDKIQTRVRRLYSLQHQNQTVEFVKQKRLEWLKFDKMEAGLLEALDMLDSYVDESDPDVDHPNIVHGYQTAEAIRAKRPDDDWLQLTGLIHDLGKVLGMFGSEPWATTGDTYPVGCAPSKQIVFYDTFKQCPDFQDSRYNTEYGMYEPNCGLRNLLMAWGHDEYLYQVLKNHKECKLPEEALYLIRFHSFYPWHTFGAYRHLCDDYDMGMLPWSQEFQKFDLYTKKESLPDIESLKPYYRGLVEKYCPGKLKW